MKQMTKRRVSGLTITKFARDVWSVCFGQRKKLVFVVRIDGLMTTARGPYPPGIPDQAIHAVRKADPAAR